MFIVRFEPRRALSFADTKLGMYNDWQTVHGPSMDAPAWLPRGSAEARPAGASPDGQGQAWVDSGHILREIGV